MNRVSRNATQLSLRHAGRRCGPTSSANNFCQCVTGFTSPIIRFTVLGVERWWLHEWSAHERVGGRMKSKFFILFSSTWLLWRDPTPPQPCPTLIPSRRPAVSVRRFRSGRPWSSSWTFPAHCLLSAPVVVYERRRDRLWYRSGTMPIHCTELPLRPNPSPSPFRRIANSMRRLPLRRQSFASSDPEHCQLNVRVALWHRFLRCYPSSVLPSQYAGLPLQAPTSVSSLPPMYRWRPSIPILYH